MENCLRCGHEWKARVKKGKPRRCPNCTSPAWDRALKRRGRKKGVKSPGKTVARIPAEHAEVMVIPPPDPIDQAREILRRINA